MVTQRAVRARSGVHGKKSGYVCQYEDERECKRDCMCKYECQCESVQT